MELKAKNITYFFNDRKKVKALLKTAFPKRERIPFFLLSLLAKRESHDFLAYYDGDSFCGFSFSVHDGNMVFVLFLAVNPAVRSQGYGSKILDDLKQRYSCKTLTLNIEPPNVHADNSEQRIKRLKFYEKNGFSDTGYSLVDNGDTYMILSTSDCFWPEEYESVLQKMVSKSYHPKIMGGNGNGFQV